MTDDTNKPMDKKIEPERHTDRTRTGEKLSTDSPEVNVSNVRVALKSNPNKFTTFSPDGNSQFKLTGDLGNNSAESKAVQARAYEAAGLGNPNEPVGKPINFVQETGQIIDYKPVQHSQNSFSLGLDYEDKPDTRTPGEKLKDFMQAAAGRAIDPEGWKTWAQAEINKFAGIGAGLNEAKEDTKSAVAAGWKALTDGTVVEFLSHSNAINAPAFKVVANAFEAMSKDPEAVNKAFETLGKVVMKASEGYGNLPDDEKGKVIGKVMFGMVNPEGDLKDAEAALKVADLVATHVDKAVWDTAAQAMKSVQEVAKSAPEVAQQTKQMLLDYLASKGFNKQQFAMAGVPDGYFEGMEPSPLPGKGDNVVYSVADKGDGASGIAGGGMDSTGNPLSFSKESGIELGSARQGQDKVWEQAPFPRGDDVHVALGENLPAGTKTIDRVVIRDGVVESQKSIDLEAPTYQNPGALESRLSGCVHDLEHYRGQQRIRSGFQMREPQIYEKVLHLGIKNGAMTEEQKAVFEKVGKAIQKYNDALPPGKAPITLKVTVVK